MFLFFVKQKTAYEMRISDWISDLCSSDRQFVLRRHSCNPLPISMPVEYRTLAESQPHRDNPGSSCRSFDSIPHGQPSRPSSQQTPPNRSFPPPSGRRGKLEEIQGNLASVLSYAYQDLHDPFGQGG